MNFLNRACRPLPTNYNIAPINLTGTEFDLVSAIAANGNPIQIYGCELQTSVATTIDLQSKTSPGTTHSFGGPMPILATRIDPPVGRAGMDVVLPWKECQAGDAFHATTGVSCTLTGEIYWRADPAI